VDAPVKGLKLELLIATQSGHKVALASQSANWGKPRVSYLCTLLGRNNQDRARNTH